MSDRATFKTTNKKVRTKKDEYRYSDGTILVLNNNNLSNFDVVFKGLWPTSLSTIGFDVTGTDNDFLTATATFKYTLYEIRNTNTTTLR